MMAVENVASAAGVAASSLEISITIATVVIAFFTVVMALLQWRPNCHNKKVARANYALALHQQRLELVYAVEEFLGEFFKTGEPSLEKVARLRYQFRHASLIFPKDAIAPIDEFFDQSGKHYVLKAELERLISDRIPVRSSDEPERTDAEEEARRIELEKQISDTRDKMYEIVKWMLAQTEGGVTEAEWFKPMRKYMELPPSL